MNDLVTIFEFVHIMECPVCQEIPFPPIFQCTRGHNICKNCKPKLKEYPTCRGSFSEARNYAVEQLVLASKHSCPYKEDGCPIELQGELMETHMKECSYRPFKCPWFGIDKCSHDLLTLPHAKKHFLNVHSANSSEGSSQTFACTIPFELISREGSIRRLNVIRKCPPRIFEFDGKVFTRHIIAMNQTICFAFLCIGSEEEAQKYRVKIICQPDKELEIQWSAPVTPITKGAELINMEARYNAFISSCTLDNLIQMADSDEVNLTYRFNARYTIFKKNV